MTFDTTVPAKLKKTQKWFASIITRPIDLESRMNPLSPSGNPMELEAAEFITPSPTLRPAQRIELYNQQYWWRLLSVMHENFPFVTRLFGYQDFNRLIGFPYLTKYPSRHWSLNRLGEDLIKWLEEEYQESDKELILTAASIDWAYCNSFSAEEMPAVTPDKLPVPGDINSLLTARLYLQPHIYLFNLKGNYFDVRHTMIMETVEHWLENDFPALDTDQKNYYFVVFRNLNTDLVWNQISEAEYKLLSRFHKGATIEECCDWLEKQKKASLKNACEHIQQWFKEWVARRWLTLENNQCGKKHVRKTTKK